MALRGARAELFRSVSRLHRSDLSVLNSGTLVRQAAPFCSRSHEPPAKAEQLDTGLIPEIHVKAVRKSRRPEKSPWKTLGARSDREAKSVWRDCTPVLREEVISKYRPGGAQTEAAALAPSIVVLDGELGVGKSSLLLQSVAHARANGYIVVFVPDAASWTYGGGFFTPAAVDGKEPSLEGLGTVRFYDRPQELHNVFRSLLKVHRHDLADLETHPELANDMTKDCVTLLDLVKLGNSLLDDIDSNWRLNPTRAGDVFSHLLDELIACSDRPVALVIDNYESMTGLTCMINERQERLHANSIRAVAEHLGREAIEQTADKMANGFVMLALNAPTALPTWRSSRVRSGVEFPLSQAVLRDPSGRKWLKEFRERARDDGNTNVKLFQVPDMSRGELQVLQEQFTGDVVMPENGPVEEGEMVRLAALSGGRGDQLQKILAIR